MWGRGCDPRRTMPEPLRHCFDRVDDVELHWAELGEPGERAPVVLIHGLTDSHSSWRRIAPGLAEDRRVLMIDLPGCGLSGRPDASYGLQWQAQLVDAWLAQLDLQSVDVVGHSYGGGVAQMLLLARPLRVRRLVLAASGGLGREVGFWLKFGTFPFFVEHFGQPFMAFGTRHALRSMIKSPRATELADATHEDIEALAKMNAQPGTARAFSRTVRDVIDFGGQTRHFAHRLHEVKAEVPIAVLWGEDDGLIPMQHGLDFVALFEHAIFVSIPGCGHYLHIERPAEFLEAVRHFLDDEQVEPAVLKASPAPPPS